MMDRTDRHARFFLRLLSHRTLLYTEMVTAMAIVHGDAERHLAFDPRESPVALQLGGSDPKQLRKAAALAERFGYVEVNLKVSERKYGSWPTHIRSLFEPSRTVRAGKETFELIVEKEGI